jgi:electron transport complex protein RnfB
MSSNELFMHYVCTLEEAKELISKHDKFWVSNCGCRESGSGCKQSRTDVCLMFSFEGGSSGSSPHEISKAEVQEIIKEAIDKKLVARPFRNADFTETDGICFCCQDCCGYFLDGSERCNKGKFIEKTDMDLCISCGLCIQSCYFGARTMQNELAVIDNERCYGCGLCVNDCPVQCISMVAR